MQSCRLDDFFMCRNVLCGITELALNVIRRSVAMARVNIDADPDSKLVTAMVATWAVYFPLRHTQTIRNLASQKACLLQQLFNQP